jgi:hypothetical protein
MSVSKSKQTRKSKKSPASKLPDGGRIEELNPSAPQLTEQRDRGQPGGGQGRVDIVANVPDDVRVDPDITEGHPGYDESGASEIHPLKAIEDRQPSMEKGRPR